MLVVPQAHPLASRSQVEISELTEETFISGEARDANRIALQTACARAGFKPNVAFETVDYSVTQTLVASGLGVALIPLLACDSLLPTTPVEARLAGKVLSRRIALAHRRGERSPLVRALLREIQAA
jgi:LysR family transcriptional activator of glutamate synthase operon